MAIPLSDVSELNNLLYIYNQSDKFLVDLQKTVITHQNLEYIISKNSLQHQTKEQQINLFSQHKRPINQVSTSSKNKSLIKDVFDYIQNQKTFSHQQNQFKSNIVSIIQQLMNDEQNRGWNQMYSQIHEMILNEIINNKQNSMIQEIQDVEVNQYSFCLIKRIMQKIEVEIKDFNLQFCKFGVILNDVGERCLFYYATFTIWRILCFGQWKSTECNINEFKNLKEKLYTQFKKDIQQNKKEQSKIRGQILSTEIITQAKQRFYIEYSKDAKKILTDSLQESSYDIIYNLDKEILEKQNKNITDSQILEYIRNQPNYIQTYVKQKSIKIQQNIQQQLTQKFRIELKIYLTKVMHNTRNLDNFTVYPLEASDYFIYLDNSDLAPGLLYKIVLSCLQGQVSQQLLDMIKPSYRDAFSTDDFHVFQIPLYPPLQSSSDAEIQILFDFVQAFQNKINLQIKGLEQLEIDIYKLDIQSELDALEQKQIGCLECCPICKRKCDQEIDDSLHKHQCRNGHQLRGMNGVLIGCHPSLYTCEEIQDDFQIQELRTNAIKQWKDIKAIYNNWRFTCFTNEELKSLKDKFTRIWNQNIGQMICKQLTQEFGQDVFYVQKQLVESGQRKEQLQKNVLNSQ